MNITKKDVGRKVFSNLFEEGTIVDVKENGTYPVIVDFEYKSSQSFTVNGRWSSARGVADITWVSSEPKGEQSMQITEKDVGRTVYSKKYGFGRIRKYESPNSEFFNVAVEFDKDARKVGRYYTENGRHQTNEAPDLCWAGTGDKDTQKGEQSMQITEKDVGRRVWDFIEKWGIIKYGSHDSFRVLFDNGICADYWKDGIIIGHSTQTLFWNELKYEIPSKPKRKVKKTVEAWMRINEYGSVVGLYYNLPDANRNVHSGDATVKLTGEYEVEEE